MCVALQQHAHQPEMWLPEVTELLICSGYGQLWVSVHGRLYSSECPSGVSASACLNTDGKRLGASVDMQPSQVLFLFLKNVIHGGAKIWSWPFLLLPRGSVPSRLVCGGRSLDANSVVLKQGYHLWGCVMTGFQSAPWVCPSRHTEALGFLISASPPCLFSLSLPSALYFQCLPCVLKNVFIWTLAFYAMEVMWDRINGAKSKFTDC